VLTELHITNFKCFESLALPLHPLTLLSGTNGGGKSSVIQSLVLLAHTVSRREWSDSLLLDGPELALGSAADVLNQRAARRRLSLGASTQDQTIRWSFAAEDRRALSVELFSIEVDGQELAPTPPLRWLLPAGWSRPHTVVDVLRRMSWVTAERTGPRELLPLRDFASHAQVGSRGELAAGLLHWRGADTDVREPLRKAGALPTLFHQVRARMQEFFPGCDLRVSSIDGASAVSLRLKSDAKSEFQRPQNVGFGLTQLFPIVVAILAAEEGDCLLIENPEVHLHPRAQQHIGWLMAVAAASGVQVIVETHSDHVLNGLRLATKQKRIEPAKVAVHFFSPSQTGEPVQPRSPTIDADGRLSEWPDGFFDQFDVALAELL
jgi:predicted ATPase